MSVERTCRGCGCTDSYACVDDAGEACAWILLDLFTPTGVCSCCADALDYQQEFLALVGTSAQRQAADQLEAVLAAVGGRP